MHHGVQTGHLTTTKINIFEVDRTESLRALVHGQLWVSIGESQFPGEFWNDNVVVVLGWWNDALFQWMKGDPMGEFLFMEGSYQFRLVRGDGGQANLQTFRREKRVSEWIVCPLQLGQEVLSASREVLRICQAQQWLDANTRKLKQASDRLERELASASKS